MKKSICIAVSLFFLNLILLNQVQAQEAVKTTTLPAGTRVIFELNGSFLSENISEGSIIVLTVMMPVIIAGEQLVFKNAYAHAKVTKYHRPGVFGRGECIEFSPELLIARDGQTIPINGETIRFKGESRSILAIGLSTLIPAAGFATKAKETRVLGAFAMTGLLIKGETISNTPKETIQLIGTVSTTQEIGPTLAGKGSKNGANPQTLSSISTENPVQIKQ